MLAKYSLLLLSKQGTNLRVGARLEFYQNKKRLKHLGILMLYELFDIMRIEICEEEEISRGVGYTRIPPLSILYMWGPRLCICEGTGIEVATSKNERHRVNGLVPFGFLQYPQL